MLQRVFARYETLKVNILFNSCKTRLTDACFDSLFLYAIAYEMTQYTNGEKRLALSQNIINCNDPICSKIWSLEEMREDIEHRISATMQTQASLDICE